MRRVVSWRIAAHPEDHKPGHCDCSCFGRGFTLMLDDENPVAFGRIVSRDEENVYIDWYELYGKEASDMDEYLEYPHADPWPLTLFTEYTRG